MGIASRRHITGSPSRTAKGKIDYLENVRSKIDVKR